jgi:hypothetical protein
MNQLRELMNRFDNKIETVKEDGILVSQSTSVSANQRAIQEKLINLRESAQYILHHSGTIEDKTIYTPSSSAATISESNGEILVEATEDVDALTVTVGETVVDEPTSVVAGNTFTYPYTDEMEALVEWESTPDRVAGESLSSAGVTETTTSGLVIDKFEQTNTVTNSDYVRLNSN